MFPDILIYCSLFQETIIVASSTIPAAYAQLSKDNGASEFAPNADPDQAAGGWMPQEAPGHCIGCDAAEDNPGQEAQDAGIIGKK